MRDLKEPDRITLADGFAILLKKGIPAEQAKIRLRQAFIQKVFAQAPAFGFSYDDADIDWVTGSVKIPRKAERFCPTFLRRDLEAYFFEDPMAPNSRSLPLAKMPRDQVQQRLQERIDAAKEIILGPIRSGDDLRAAEAREKKWLTYNAAMLSSMFTTDQFADEYRSARVLVHLNADRYTDPSLDTLASRLNESRRRQVALLESVIERLELIDEVSSMPNNSANSGEEIRNKIFVVHGHDGEVRETVARFISEKLGFEPVVLHERPNKGRTIITKFREEGAGVGFAVVLMTPDDVGKVATAVDLRPRARQNVVFELGFFIGVLGPERVAAVVKGEVERPSDFDGVVYISFDKDDWRVKLGQELEAAGYTIDWNKAMRA